MSALLCVYEEFFCYVPVLQVNFDDQGVIEAIFIEAATPNVEGGINISGVVKIDLEAFTIRHTTAFLQIQDIVNDLVKNRDCTKGQMFRKDIKWDPKEFPSKN